MSVPKRDDEKALWAALEAGETVRAAAARLGIQTGRVEYLCTKWSRKGVYEWGTVCDLGWIVRPEDPRSTPPRR